MFCFTSCLKKSFMTFFIVTQQVLKLIVATSNGKIVINLNQCFSTRGTVRTCANRKNCSADDKRSADKCE